jgi:cytochrome P450
MSLLPESGPKDSLISSILTSDHVTVFTLKTAIIAAIVLYFLVPFLQQCYSFLSKMSKIPSAPGSWPLFGHLPMIFQIMRKESCNESQAMHYMIESFVSDEKLSKDGMFKVYFGPIPIVVVTSPEPTGILLKSKTLPKSFIYKYLDLAAVGLANLNGDVWKYHRKLLTPAFDYKMVQGLPDILTSNGKMLVKELDEDVKTSGKIKNMNSLMSLYSLRVLLESALGLNDATMCEIFESSNGHEVIDKLETVFDQMSNILIERMLMPWNFFDNIFMLTPLGKRAKKLLDYMTGLIRMVVDRRQEDISSGKVATTDKNTFMDILLREHETNPNMFTDKDVDGELRTFLAAGHETTATTLTWFLFYVGHHPEVQAKIQQELDEIYESKESGEDEGITLNDLRSMKYLEAAINESLRLTASVPIFSRTADADFVINDKYTIPKLTVLVFYPYFLHRNPTVWSDPLKYDPNRFYMQDKMRGNVPHSFIPFSAGHRSCIGQKYAMLTMLGITSVLFRHFNITSINPVDQVKGLMNVSFRPDQILQLNVQKRSQSNEVNNNNNNNDTKL